MPLTTLSLGDNSDTAHASDWAKWNGVSGLDVSLSYLLHPEAACGALGSSLASLLPQGNCREHNKASPASSSQEPAESRATVGWAGGISGSRGGRLDKGMQRKQAVGPSPQTLMSKWCLFQRIYNEETNIQSFQFSLIALLGYAEQLLSPPLC